MNIAFVFKRDDISASKRTLFNINKLHVFAWNEFVSNLDAGFHHANILETFFKKVKKKDHAFGSVVFSFFLVCPVAGHIQNWEQGRRLNPLLHIMSVTSYRILYPATKLFFKPTDSPSIHSLRFNQAMIFVYVCLSLSLHHYLYLLLSSLSVACIILAARYAHRRFIKGMLIYLCYLKNNSTLAYIFYLSRKKLWFFNFLIKDIYR